MSTYESQQARSVEANQAKTSHRKGRLVQDQPCRAALACKPLHARSVARRRDESSSWVAQRGCITCGTAAGGSGNADVERASGVQDYVVRQKIDDPTWIFADANRALQVLPAHTS